MTDMLVTFGETPSLVCRILLADIVSVQRVGSGSLHMAGAS